MIKVGDKISFRKFTWVITRITDMPRYRVYRKYFNRLIPLAYTEQDYPILEDRWNFLKKKVKENPDYHYNMSLWSNQKR